MSHRTPSIVLAAALAAWLAAPSQAAAQLAGVWAAEASDCRRNDFAWHFRPDGVALLIDNRPIVDYLPVRYEMAGRSGRVVFSRAGGGTIEFAVQLLGERELAITGVNVNGAPVRITSYGNWVRCDAGR